MKRCVPINGPLLKQRILDRGQQWAKDDQYITYLRLYEKTSINPSTLPKIFKRNSISDNVALRLIEVGILVPYI